MLRTLAALPIACALGCGAGPSPEANVDPLHEAASNRSAIVPGMSPARREPALGPQAGPQVAADVEPQAGPEVEPHDPGSVVLRMTDGSGTPIHLAALRDWQGHAGRLVGHVLVERHDGYQLRKGKTAAVSFSTRLSAPERVGIAIRSPEIATGSGLSIGLPFEAVRDRAPDLSCDVEYGEGGTFVWCDAGGVTLEFHLGDRDVPLPDPMTAEHAAAAIGTRTVSALTWALDRVPDPVVTTDPPGPPAYGVLPAGIYWRDSYSPCDLDLAIELCIVPRFAVLAGVHEDVAAATATFERVSGATLEAGYPLVAHTDELGLEDASTRGIAIVLGLFAGETEAGAWIDDHAALGPVTKHAVLGPQRANARAAERSEPTQMIVRVRPGRAQGRRDCPVPGGSFAVFPESTIDATVYEHVPARCPDERETTIPWRDSLVGAVHLRTESGPVLVQLVGAECDSPLYERWTVGSNGATKGRGRPITKRRC